MPRSYTKTFDVVFDFYESDFQWMRVDTSPWTSAKQAADSLRRVIQKKRFDNIVVVSRKGDVMLFKK